MDKMDPQSIHNPNIRSVTDSLLRQDLLKAPACPVQTKPNSLHTSHQINRDRHGFGLGWVRRGGARARASWFPTLWNCDLCGMAKGVHGAWWQEKKPPGLDPSYVPHPCSSPLHAGLLVCRCVSGHFSAHLCHKTPSLAQPWIYRPRKQCRIYPKSAKLSRNGPNSAQMGQTRPKWARLGYECSPQRRSSIYSTVERDGGTAASCFRCAGMVARGAISEVCQTPP
mmetsp:Transcript_11470/g.20714  ORF Transcript_11470/g.20714 Transcript_11470/m.20714 type:complete len:225 (+) Transcript_11470:1311-1985(+)